MSAQIRDRTRRSPARAAVVVVALLLASSLGAAPVGGASADPTDEATAIASLLEADDLGDATNGDGVSVSSADDLPGYLDNGGLREVSQTWFSDDPVRSVFDFRWQFPDAASAAAFLDAAEEALSEASTGAERGMLLLDPLPDTRFYTFEDRILGTDTVGYNFLMRHENLVAKVYVAGSGADITQSDAVAIAEAAAARMVAAVGSGPAASPEASPEASGAPVDAAAALDELLSHVPAAVRDTCAQVTGGGGPASDAGELAEVRCPRDGAQLTFVLYDTVEALDAAYDTAHEYARVFGSFTLGSDCAGGAYDGSWSVGGVDAGRLLCHELHGEASVVWSHPATRILSIIRQPDADHAAAWDLWLAAGPE